MLGKNLAVLFLLLPVLSWAACKEHEATEVSVLQLVNGESVIWQSPPSLAQASVVDGVEFLCFEGEKKSKERHFSVMLELDGQAWWLAFTRLENLELPIKLEATVSKFSVRGESGQCQSMNLSLTENPWKNENSQQCLMKFEGLSLRLLAVQLTKQQIQEAQDKKGFWQFDEADDKAKRRMKKI